MFTQFTHYFEFDNENNYESIYERYLSFNHDYRYN